MSPSPSPASLTCAATEIMSPSPPPLHLFNAPLLATHWTSFQRRRRMTACASDCEFRHGGKLRLCDPRLLPDEGLEGYVHFRYRRYQWCCPRSTRGGLKEPERPYRPPQRHIPLWDWISRCFDERPSILGGCRGC
jgi:hypothetical protein